MDNKLTISFENLPQITSNLNSEIKALRASVEQLIISFNKGKSTNTEEPIGIDEACEILGLKKPTVYRKVQCKEIPAYKPQGSKKLMFKRSDLVKWLTSNHNSSYAEADIEQAIAEMSRGVRHKPKSMR